MTIRISFSDKTVKVAVEINGAIESAITELPKREWAGLTEQDMPSGQNPMFDHEYFIAGMVYAAKVLQEKNNAAPAAQPEQRKPLDEWVIDRLANNIRTADPVTWWRQLARDVENAHNIKEKP
tara:strand:- start:270 stop:638 length:369 start_codon:yes stop_codon:yes gene_type:complete